MAAAVADFRPAEAAEGKLVREGSGGMELRARGDRGRARRRSPAAAGRARRWSASPPSTAAISSSAPAASSSARASTRSSSTTSPTRRSASTVGENDVTIVEREAKREVGRARQGRDRRRDPRPDRRAAGDGGGVASLAGASRQKPLAAGELGTKVGGFTALGRVTGSGYARRPWLGCWFSGERPDFACPGKAKSGRGCPSVPPPSLPSPAGDHLGPGWWGQRERSGSRTRTVCRWTGSVDSM